MTIIIHESTSILRVSYIFLLPSNNNGIEPNFVPLRNCQNYLGMCTIVTKATLIIYLAITLNCQINIEHTSNSARNISHKECYNS